jgi:hypothetical protein
MFIGSALISFYLIAAGVLHLVRGEFEVEPTLFMIPFLLLTSAFALYYGLELSSHVELRERRITKFTRGKKAVEVPLEGAVVYDRFVEDGRTVIIRSGEHLLVLDQNLNDLAGLVEHLQSRPGILYKAHGTWGWREPYRNP